MSPLHNPPSSGASPGSDFRTTRWSVVIEAGRSTSPQSRQALESLCACYWPPLYAFIRRRGYRAEQAQDLTQEFFTQILEKNSLQAADRRRGKFRSFLLASLKNFLANQHRAVMAQKRGGGLRSVSLDFQAAETKYSLTPEDKLTPDRIFERQWALLLLERALRQLAEEQSAAGNGAQFEQLQGFLTVQNEGDSYREVADRMAMTAGAVKTAVHRLRRRYRGLLRDEIAQTVASPDEIDEELQDLFRALGPENS